MYLWLYLLSFRLLLPWNAWKFKKTTSERPAARIIWVDAVERQQKTCLIYLHPSIVQPPASKFPLDKLCEAKSASGQKAQTTGAYPSFCGILKAARSMSTHLDGMLVHDNSKALARVIQKLITPSTR